MNILFGYGKEEIPLILEDNIQVLDGERFEDFSFNLKDFLEKIDFKENKLGIIFPDTTRPLPAKEILDLIYPRIKDKKVKIFIATGTHRKPSDKELKDYLGDFLEKFEIIINEPENENLYERVGKTERGTEVEILKEVLKQEKIFCFTVCRPHYYAGFSGGRKIFVPGVASYKTIQQNHRNVLDPNPKKGKNKKAVLGVLEGNPVHFDMMEVLKLIPVPFELFNFVILNKKIIYGSFNFEEAVSFIRNNFEFKVKEKFDNLIVSSGGFPFDLNFIQGHKCLEHSVGGLKEGGKIYAYVEAKEGFGSKDCIEFLKLGSIEEVSKKLREDFKVYGHTALTILLKAKRFDINLHTSLSDSDLKFMGYKRWDGKTLPKLKGKTGIIREGSIFYFPQG